MKAPYKDLLARLRSALPGSYIVGKMVVVPPVERLLRGLYVEGSVTPGCFYVWAFVQPLFVPSTSVTFNFGFRVGGPAKVWCAEDAAQLSSLVGTDVVPFLDGVKTLDLFVDSDLLRRAVGPKATQARAYGLGLLGRREEADRLVSEVSKLSEKGGWQAEMAERAVRLKEALERDGAAVRLLDEWQHQTETNVGLKR